MTNMTNIFCLNILLKFEQNNEATLSRIQDIINNKKILPSTKINLQNLKKSNLINNKYRRLKLLGSGDIKNKFDFEVNFISKSAKEKIEKSGGKVILIK